MPQPTPVPPGLGVLPRHWEGQCVPPPTAGALQRGLLLPAAGDGEEQHAGVCCQVHPRAGQSQGVGAPGAAHPLTPGPRARRLLPRRLREEERPHHRHGAVSSELWDGTAWGKLAASGARAGCAENACPKPSSTSPCCGEGVELWLSRALLWGSLQYGVLWRGWGPWVGTATEKLTALGGRGCGSGGGVVLRGAALALCALTGASCAEEELLDRMARKIAVSESEVSLAGGVGAGQHRGAGGQHQPPDTT